MSTGSDAPQPPFDPHRPPPGWHPGEPGSSPPQPYPPRPPMRPEDERLWAIAAHLGPLVLGVVAPLVVWLVFRDRSAFLDRSAKEALNMQISYLVYGLVAGFSLLLLVGLVLLPLVMLAWIVLMVLGTVKAGALEDWRYPAIFRVVP